MFYNKRTAKKLGRLCVAAQLQKGDMMQQTCQTCAYFIRHYAKWGKGYSALALGHCYKPRIKPRKIDAPACPRYRARTGDGNPWL